MPQKRLPATTEQMQPCSQEVQMLTHTIGVVAAAPSAFWKQYGESLMTSVDAFAKIEQNFKKKQQPPLLIQLIDQLAISEFTVAGKYTRLSALFESGHSQSRWLKAGRLWPSTSPYSLLENLRSTLSISFGKNMKEALVDYALSLTQHQRLLRMIDASRKASLTRLAAEHENAGHGNWQPLHHSDWLLFELDTNVLLRDEQITVARATIEPQSGSNSLLQLSMGKGKTSCIIPIVASDLADSQCLVRVVVPRQLLAQTYSLLLSRIGGLVGRRVVHVPFSRRTPINHETIEAYFNIHKQIRKSRGIMLTAPEHLLSFKLCGLQCLSDHRHAEAVPMVNVQNWLNDKARDVVDESDHVFSTRTALVFPSGNLALFDGQDHRWRAAEELLRIVGNRLWILQERFPRSIEVIDRNNQGFPFFFFLKPDVEDALISGIVSDVCSGLTGILPTGECNASELNVIKQFLSKQTVSEATIEEFRKMWPDNPELRKKVLLLRGLLVHRILLLTLKKRFNVQYGLSELRDPIAVPFHAKGVASELSEFGFPDVAILLTILAHYYQGMGIEQTRQNLEMIAKHDDPRRVYEGLVQNIANFPDALRDYDSLNQDDEFQLLSIWKATQFDMNFINFHLNTFVFPRHAKQFSVKLQASAWDLGLSAGRTTGFSGTHDGKSSFPLMIRQNDLPELEHTSAEVLSYLLQPRNRGYAVMTDNCGRRLSEENLLRKIKGMSIRVLIDAGAQILELTNAEVARRWLEIDHVAPAAVYFNEANKPFVRFRGGRFLPLSATPFAEDLTGLLVYIDQEHTRGTVITFALCIRWTIC